MSALNRAVLLIVLLVSSVSAQSKTPISQKELFAWLIGGKATSRIAADIKQRGLAFSTTPEVVQFLRSIGASDTVISAITAAKHSDNMVGFDESAEVYKRAAELKRDGSLEGAYRKLTSSGEMDFKLHFALAGILRAAEFWDPARKEYLIASQLDPKSIDALQGLSYAQYRLGLGKASQVSAEQAVSLDPMDSDSHKFLGLAYEVQENFNDAVRELNKAIDLNPRNAAAYFDLGITLMKKKDDAGAAAAYKRAIEINPTRVDYYLNLGGAQSRLGKREEAVQTYKQAKKLDPDDLRILNNLAMEYCKLNQYDRAIVEASDLLKRDPDWNMIRPCLAKAQYAVNDFAGAIATDEEFLKREPEDVDVLIMLAEYYAHEKRYADAEQLYHRQLAIAERDKGKQSEEYADALAQIAFFRSQQQDWAGAETYWLQAIGILKNLPSARFTKYPAVLSQHATALRKLGRLEEASKDDQLVSSVRTIEASTAEDTAERWNALYMEGFSKHEAPDCGLDVYKKAYVIAKTVPDEGYSAVVTAQAMSSCYVKQRQNTEREKLLRDLVEFEKAKYPNSRSLADAYDLLQGALPFNEKSALPERISLLESSLAIRQQKLLDEQSLEATRKQLLYAYYAGGYPEKALPMLRTALDHSEKKYGPQSRELVQPLQELAACLARLQKWAEAEQFSRRALTIAESAFGDSERVRFALHQLVEITEALGKHKESDELESREQTLANKLYPHK